MEIRWLGHAAFALEHEGVTVLIDPFISGNPVATAEVDELEADAILLTHGHMDHLGDTVAIAKRTGATVQAITELAGELGEEGIETIDTNLGGTADYPWGSVRLVPAWHTSTTPKGMVSTPAGGAAVVIPQHYDTFPPIATDAQVFKAEVEAAGHARVEVLEVGGSFSA